MTKTNLNDGVVSPNTPTITAIKAVRPKLIGKLAAAKLISENTNKFMTVTFLEKNKSRAKNAPALIERTMTCRANVTKYTKAGKAAIESGNPLPKSTPNKDLALIGKMNVFEMTGDRGYKTLNLDTVISFKLNKESYKVRK